MLNHTYTSVKNANLVDCGKKQHIPSTPSALLRDNYLGEYRTELDKKKVLANLGIATDLSLEWEYIKGDIGRSEALMKELDSRTVYISKIDSFNKTIIEGVQYLETVVGGEQEAEAEQNQRLEDLETASQELVTELENLKTYISDTVEINIETLEDNLKAVTDKVDNITELIKVSTKEGNALVLLTADDVEEGVTPGLYVPDLSTEVSDATTNIKALQESVKTINDSLDDFVTKEDLGGDGDFNFVKQDDYDSYVEQTDKALEDLNTELENTVKTGEDGHVKTLYVDTISKNNNDESIKITDSFEVTEGIPLDIRLVVKSLEELHALDPKVCYPGMGVIVSNQSSLYILREPANGVIDKEYIEDKESINWKCPEDLVIEVLTQEEFDQKVAEDSINPHMFYYIHEEIVEEPIRDDYDSDEAYEEALNKWLRVLQQKYMSAVWGQEIEKLVSSKAPNTAVKSLEAEIQRITLLIESLSGGSQGINLKDLNTQVEQNTADIAVLIKEGDGVIPTLRSDLDDLAKDVSDNYVTKEDITTEDPNVEYIFVKKIAFEDYKTSHDEALAASVTTEKVITNEVVLGEESLVTSEGNLLINNEKVALDKQVPVIELVDYNEFKDRPEESLEQSKYYYVYNDEERYVLETDFTSYKTQQTKYNQNLSDSTNINKLAIGTLENLTTENKTNLVLSVNELHGYISRISDDLDTLITGEGIISSMQAAIDALNKEISDKYVTIDSITKETEGVDYIFVKKSEFNTYQENHDAALALSITTEQVNTGSITLNEQTLTSEENKLKFNGSDVAMSNEVPIIEVLDDKTFKDKTDIDDDTYYYVYDLEERYVLESEFTTYKTQQSTSMQTLSNDITKNKNAIGDIETLTTENKNNLVYAVNELGTKFTDVISNIGELVNLPEGIENIAQAISDIYSKINTLSSDLQALKDSIEGAENI